MKFLLYSREYSLFISLNIDSHLGSLKSSVDIKYFCANEISGHIAEEAAHKLAIFFQNGTSYTGIAPDVIARFSLKNLERGLLSKSYSRTHSTNKSKFGIESTIISHTKKNCSKKTVHEDIEKIEISEESPCATIAINQISRSTFDAFKETCISLGHGLDRSFSWTTLTEYSRSATLSFSRLSSVDDMTYAHDHTINMAELVGEFISPE